MQSTTRETEKAKWEQRRTLAERVDHAYPANKYRDYKSHKENREGE
jgi:hypothetical protein